jgi:riboflavin synthase
MFTGLVEQVGIIEAVEMTEAGVELTISCTYTDLEDGESISVSGVCLTVRETGQGRFKTAAMVMTISRTAIGEWKAGARVHLERAMRADTRFGGHIVQGHVDGVGKVERAERH